MADRDAASPPADHRMTSEVVLLVDLPGGQDGLGLDPGCRTVEVQFAGLDAALLASILPDRVIAPLFARGFDAAQVIARLDHLGFGGALWVISPALPNRRMVETELRGLSSKLQVSLIERD